MDVEAAEMVVVEVVEDHLQDEGKYWLRLLCSLYLTMTLDHGYLWLGVGHDKILGLLHFLLICLIYF